jgi:hypothetical protein
VKEELLDPQNFLRRHFSWLGLFREHHKPFDGFLRDPSAVTFVTFGRLYPSNG